MKQNDIAALVLIVALAGVISYFVGNAVIGTPDNDPVQIEKVTKINPTFPIPDSRIFNDRAIDPAVEIKGDGSSPDSPFTN